LRKYSKMTIKQFLIKISEILDELKIDYAISGGVAVSVWGRPRYTADLDIVTKIDNANQIENLVKILLKNIKGSYADEAAALEAFQRKSEFNLVESEYGLKADFFVIGHDEYQKQELKRAKKKRIAGKMVKFISPEDLIISKLKWYQENQSDRQIEDILTVLEAGNIDMRYLHSWIKKLELEDGWEKTSQHKKGQH